MQHLPGQCQCIRAQYGIAQIVTKLEELEAALATAEAALAKAALDAYTAGGNQAEANASMDKARAYCLQVRAELKKLRRTEPITTSDETGHIPTGQPAKIADTLHSARPGPIANPAVPGESSGSYDPSRQRNPGKRFDIGFPAQGLSRDDVRARPPLLRQTIQLSVLVLAYLGYYFIEVQLQILTLPVTFYASLLE